MSNDIVIKLFMTDGLPCLLADKFIQELLTLLPKGVKVKYEKQEVNEFHEFKELAEKYKIDGLPFIIIRRDDKEYKICGFEPEEIEKAILGKVTISKKPEDLENVC